LPTALERGLQALEIFKHPQPAQRKGRLTRFGQGAANQLGIGTQHLPTRVVVAQLRLQSAGSRIKWPANGVFERLFEGTVCVRDGGGCLPQTMNLAGLMRHAGKGLGHRQDQGFLIVTHDPPYAIAQVFHWLEQTES
jgi:hypothetical protein